MNRTKINEFANRGKAFYSRSDINNYEMENFNFANECWALGFEMDGGKALESAFPGAFPLRDKDHLQAIIEAVEDVQMLGNAIFSQWRYWTHWSMGTPTKQDFQWFVIAFSRLAELTDKGRT